MEIEAVLVRFPGRSENELEEQLIVKEGSRKAGLLYFPQIEFYRRHGNCVHLRPEYPSRDESLYHHRRRRRPVASSTEDATSIGLRSLLNLFLNPRFPPTIRVSLT